MCSRRQFRYCSAKLWSLALLSFCLCLGAYGTPAEGALAESGRTLTLDDRVACQRAIEAVNWQYRIWPKENPRDKPTLDEVRPLAAIRAKVEDDLRKARALGVIWGRPLTAMQLQRELERMARGTRQPARLRAVWEALGNDPVLVAECVARPSLANRLIRSWYARDAAVHEPLARRVRAELAAVGSARDLRHLSGDYEVSTFTRGDHTASSVEAGPDATRLSDEEWGAQAAHLRSLFEGERERGEVPDLPDVGTRGVIEAIPVGVVSPLEETEEAYRVTAVLEMNQRHLRLATVSWQKRAFADWWAATAPQIPLEAEPIGETYWLPAIRTGDADCTDDTWRSTFALEGRSGHSAVWTGTEMIVWGGVILGAQTLVNTGARYDPATDSWMGTSTLGAPTARTRHTTIWSGSEMIVWGGQVDARPPLTLTDTGGRYDPTTDTWEATGTLEAPTARRSHTAVWTGTEMIVWGGEDVGLRRLDTGGRYDPTTDSWVATNTMEAPSARYDHAAVWTGSEMIVWGGVAVTAGGRYDPVTDTWAAMSTLEAPTARRSGHTAVWTGTEMIVWGGRLTEPPFTLTNTGGRYDPMTDAWMATNTMEAPSERDGHTAMWTGTEMIVWGGRLTDPFARTNTGGRYDPATNTWVATSTVEAPGARSDHTAVWTGTEMILWGGLLTANRAWRYDPAIDTWVGTSRPTPTGSAYHTAVWTGTEMMVWGGFGGPSTGWRYDPATDTWLAISTVDAPASVQNTAVWTGTEMIVWGGSGGGPGTFTGGRYDPVTDAWVATSTVNMPTARRVHTAIWTGTEMIVWGGTLIETPSPRTNTGGRYDPATDTWMATNTVGAPSARTGPTAVWSGTEMIVWGGGTEEGRANTGGRYDLATDTWVETSTGETPSARTDHTAVWTGTEMIVWGGLGPPTNTGGRYDPAIDTWVATSTLGAPSARDVHSAVWTGSEMIVWGGWGDFPTSSTGGRYCASPTSP